MYKYLYFFIVIFLASCGNNSPSEKKADSLLVHYVNPLIGTTGQNGSEYGGMIPGVTMPFGMTQWTAMTRENMVSRCPYHYSDEKIIGFIGTHQPAIWMGDYGNVSIMPQIGEPKIRFDERALDYLHKDEISYPYYYSVKMKDDKKLIQTEITSTTRCGFFNISFPENEAPSMTIDMSKLSKYNGFVKIIPEKNQIIGYNSDRHNEVWGSSMGPSLENFKGYFVLQFDTEFSSYGCYSDTSYAYKTLADIKRMDGQKEISGSKIGAYVSFLKNTKQVKLKIATSFVSLEQAQENLDKELPDWDFEKTKIECRDIWENQLNRIKVEGGTEDQKTNFYTSMYHSLLYPRIFSEYGKYYSAFDDTIHSGVSYNDYSLWDTYRALHPLLVFTAPEHVNPMITSLLQMYDEGGWMPKWPNLTYSNIMIGTHADAVIADAYAKGFRGFDLDKAYDAMYKNAMVEPEGDDHKDWGDRAVWTSYEARGGLSGYKKLGYVPADKTHESVSRTLEFAYDDFCVAQIAKALGKTEDYNLFMDRSKNYTHVYNKEAGFMQPKLSDGQFFTGNYRKYRAFTEGSQWTYLFCVMHDVEGLIDLMGSPSFFTERLDENFSAGHHRHSNEPGHHYAYLYNYVDQAWKTQETVNEILNQKYKNKPDGLCGNDDCGQMSAWYIFSSMGFYPVCPGSEQYAIGAPLFEKITLHLDPTDLNKTFTIKVNNYSSRNIYVKSITLDGKQLDKPFINHSDILNGKLLEFEMDSIPNK